ncbi:MAG: DNA topoisomerase I, partial [Chloroflexi bacterium]|nr:DNA topoisomerase I [Chloroflexota bacterium]
QSDNESEEACDLCGKPMTLRRGRFGPFYACTGYPECKNTRRLPKAAPRDTGVPCPRCGGNLVERRGRRGPFYGCSNFPTCNFLVNRQPLPQPCPECDGLMVVGARQQANCTNCAWKGPLPEGEPASVA